MTTETTFLEITDSTLEQLKEAWMIIEPHLFPILDDFYDYIVTYSELKSIIGDRDTAVLKKAQYEHWKSAFLGDLGANYMKSTVRIGEAHVRVGLNPSWYINSYCFLLNKVQAAILNHYKKRYKESREMVLAVNKLFMLDMSQAISSYEKTIKEQAAEHLKSLLDEFKHNIGGSIETIASSAEELDASIGEIASQIDHNSKQISKTNIETKKAAEKIINLNKLSEKIGDTIELIVDISEQTNMLALNASIEAARAGSAGRGFSVVAEEVKILAGSTNNATEEISGNVKNINDGANEAGKAIKLLNKEMEDINNSIVVVTGSIREQKTASANISQNINSINDQINSMTEALIKDSRSN